MTPETLKRFREIGGSEKPTVVVRFTKPGATVTFTIYANDVVRHSHTNGYNELRTLDDALSTIRIISSSGDWAKHYGSSDEQYVPGEPAKSDDGRVPFVPTEAQDVHGREGIQSLHREPQRLRDRDAGRVHQTISRLGGYLLGTPFSHFPNMFVYAST
jgi:hypothetical protein